MKKLYIFSFVIILVAALAGGFTVYMVTTNRERKMQKAFNDFINKLTSGTTSAAAATSTTASPATNTAAQPAA